jgi:hypothetical protein
MKFYGLSLLGMLFLTAAAPAQSYFYPDNRSSFQESPDALVRFWYQKYLDRDVDPGYAAWVNALASGSAPATVLAGILGSQEFYDKSGDTPEGFVQNLFFKITGRRPSEPEFRGFVRRAVYGDRTEVAYALLARYPQAWQSGALPGNYYGPQYEYRRPHWYNRY